jgi:hypothetical protein
LSAAGVCILVALPGHVVNIAHVRTQNLPVKSRVLQEHLQWREVVAEVMII